MISAIPEILGVVCLVVVLLFKGVLYALGEDIYRWLKSRTTSGEEADEEDDEEEETDVKIYVHT